MLSLTPGGRDARYGVILGLSAPSNDEITLDKFCYTANGAQYPLDSRTGMLKLHGCCDPLPTPSLSPSAPPPSYSPLACGVRTLANTMGLAPYDGWLSLYPQLHRLQTWRLNCLLTAFTIKIHAPASSHTPSPLST